MIRNLMAGLLVASCFVLPLAGCNNGGAGNGADETTETGTTTGETGTTTGYESPNTTE